MNARHQISTNSWDVPQKNVSFMLYWWGWNVDMSTTDEQMHLLGVPDDIPHPIWLYRIRTHSIISMIHQRIMDCVPKCIKYFTNSNSLMRSRCIYHQLSWDSVQLHFQRIEVSCSHFMQIAMIQISLFIFLDIYPGIVGEWLVDV